MERETNAAGLRSPRATRGRRWLRPLLVVVGLAAFAFTLHGADLPGAFALLASLGPLALVALVPQGLWTLAHAESWRRILGALGHRPKRRDLSLLFFGTEAVLFSVPAGAAIAESLSVLLLRGKLGIGVTDGVSSIATKKALVVLTNALYVLAALTLGYAAIAAASHRRVGSGALSWALLGAVVLLVLLAAVMMTSLSSGALAGRVRALLRRVPVSRLQAWLDERAVGADHADDRLAAPFRDRRAMVVAGLWLMVHWALEALETYLLLRLLGAPVSISDALAIEVISSLVRSAAVMLPAGIGAQDASYVAMLGAFGVPGAPALGAAFVLLKRAKELVWITFGYGVLAAWRKKPEPLSSTSDSPLTA